MNYSKICYKTLSLLALCCLMSTALMAQSISFDTSWIDDLQNGMSKGKSEKKPVVIYYYNNIARPCSTMKVETLEDSTVRTRLEDFIPVAVNTQDYPMLAQDAGVFKVPTVVFRDPNGNELDRAIGFKSTSDFTKYLDRVRMATSSSAGNGSGRVTPFTSAAIDITIPSQGTQQVSLTVPSPYAQQVTLVGDFNDWRKDATPMRRISSGDWAATIYLPEGVYEYKFLMNGSDYQPNMNSPFKKADPYGAMNSVLIVGNPKTSPRINGRQVTFVIYRPEAKNIQVAGSFNDWKEFTMYRNPKDPAMWGARYTLEPGTYTYKLVIDGVWMEDPENYTLIDDGIGNRNSSFTIK